MKRLLLVAILLMLLAGLPVQAQGTELTQVFNDGEFTFQYPAGWVLNTGDDGDPNLSNAALAESGGILAVGPGQIFVSVDFPGDNPYPANDLTQDERMLFDSGLGLGSLMTLGHVTANYLFAGQQDEVTGHYDQIERLTIGDHKAILAIATLDAANDYTMATIDTGDIIRLMIVTRAGEFDQWRETVLAIAGTIQRTNIPAG